MLPRTEAKNSVPNISLPESPLFTSFQGTEGRVNGASHFPEKGSNCLERGEDGKAIANHLQRQSLLENSIIDWNRGYILIVSIGASGMICITQNGTSEND
jgi:hypothetical protein